MTSTYSSNLRLELIGTGDQSSTWGTTTNTNLGTLLEQAISGVSDVVFSSDANKTLSTVNGGTDEARQMIISLTSSLSLTATRNVIVPSVDKLYVVKNGTSGGQSIVVKTSAGTGITITNGETTMVWCDGTNVYSALDYTPALTIGAGGLSLQGNFVVGGSTPSDAIGMDIDTTLATSTTTQYGVLVRPTYDDTATANIYGYSSLLTGGAAASSYTTNNVFNYRSSDFTLGTNQKVADFYGFYGDNLTAATNNYSVYLDIDAAAASTITSIVGSAGTVTVTTSGVHGLATGDKVLIANVTGAMTSGSYNGGPYTVTVTNTTVFTYSSAATSSALTTGSVVKANNWNVYAAGTGNNLFSGPVITSTSSTLPAMRITQTGTGDAFVVEDSTNPDTTPFVIDASGNVVRGFTSLVASDSSTGVAATPSIQNHGLSVSGSSYGAFTWAASAIGPNFIFSKSRGATAGTNAVVSDADLMGGITFAGDDGTAFITGATITGAVDGTPGTNDMPGRLVFSTTADGASTPTERLRITSGGNVGIGSTSITDSSLRVSKNITGSTSSQGIRSDGAIQTDSTANAYYFISSANMASGTLGNLNHYTASQGTIGATVTAQYGFNSVASLIGATVNYGFNASDTAAVTAGKTAFGFYSDIDIATGGGTTYGFYANGTATNYFGGNVGIGSTTLTNFNLRVSKPITGSTTSSAVYADGAIQTGVTANATYYQTSVNMASGTLTSLYHFQASQGTIGATVTNQYGFRTEPTLIGATNNYAFIASNSAAVTAGKTAYGYYSAVNTATGGGTTYGFYAAGTAVNYFGGNVGIGSTSLTDVSLRVSKNITGATTFYGVFSDGAIQSDVTANAYYYGTSASAVSGTLSTLRHYHARQASLGTATVATQYGFVTDDSLIGATNNYAFIAGNTAAVTAGKTAYGYYSAVNTATGGGTAYGFYANGTAVNYFNGNVGIANTSPACKLDVTGGIQTSRTTVTSPAATDGNIFSGTYTPTLTNTTNVAASTAVECFYTRVGNVVTVTGQVSIDVTTTLTDSVLLMTLPIASTFTVARNCGGTGASSTTGTYGTETIAIMGNVAGGSAEFRLRPTSVANLDYRFSFSYRVL